MTQADPQPVMAADLVIERADVVELFGKRRRRFDHPGFETAPDLAGQPWLALRAAADHDRIGSGHFKRAQRLLERRDVAVDDQRNGDRIPDRADSAPIGIALVELTA